MDSTRLAPIRQNTLADVVTDRIREAVILGQLQPGERLAEPALAEMLHISRSPIRGALQRLEEEGLVTRRSNRSCYVWTPTEADVDEVMSLRVMLESLAAERTIDRLTQKDFDHLDSMIERQRQIIENRETLQLIREDKSFHEYLCFRADHARLMQWWCQIMGQWEVLIFLRVKHDPEGVFPSVLDDHRAIVDALRRQKLDQVIALHRRINRRVSIHLKSVLRETALAT